MEKRQKIVHSGTERSSPIPGPAETTKSKRISILDLCNEIAGEIESDTVEVMKDPLSSQEPHNENNSTEEKKESTSSESVNAAHTSESDINPSKRFFPSRTPLRMKCKLDRKISPAQRSSKWSKIKLKKVNNFSQSDVPCSPAVLPNLDMIKVNSKLSQINQATSSTLNKLLDAKLPDQLAVNKLDLKKTRTGAINQKILEQKKIPENGTLENHKKFNLEVAVDEGFRLHLDSSPENSPLKMNSVTSPPFKSEQQGTEEIVSKACVSKQLFSISVADQITPADGRRSAVTSHLPAAKSNVNIQKEIKKLKEVEKDSNRQPVIDAGQKRFGAISCNVCGMLYTASNPEDESQHLLFHNQFISAVKYIGWKKERTVSEYPDGKIIMVLPDDPKYALKKVEEIREMVDNDLGFQQAPLRLHSRTKTLLFISNEKKVVGCLIAEHIQCGYRVIVDLDPDGRSEKEKAISERVKAWCCSTTPEPAICGISRIWVFSMMRRNKIASRMIDCLRNNFIYGSFLNKEEIAFSDPTPDGKLFATHYCGTGQFLVYNFVSGHNERN
ncbi:hypothetical protein GDO86_011101 [Hymenochirus boettgeri]|uniref:N-acetyltransferase ESCO1 n=1 Tax=Hymenochirus boettgeri TaxID=247094 RepID=A0A8T2JHT3_9PIPI|nr:hypothetical protein GDO86_011101 [Hymenochirus boettgeri]